MVDGALAAVHEHFGPWTEGDYLALPEDSRRIELLDGGLLVSPNPATPHQRPLSRLWRALDDVAPDGLEVLHTVNVRLAPGRILIPDLVVVTAPGERLVVLDARSVALAVEITSPGSVAMDRAVKPPLYAAAGIPHYLRIELPAAAAPSATAYELARGRYVPVAHAGPGEPLRLREPFTVTLDLAELAAATRPPR